MKKVFNKPTFTTSTLANGTVVHLIHNEVFDDPLPSLNNQSSGEAIKSRLKNMRISKEFESIIESTQSSFKAILNEK